MKVTQLKQINFSSLSVLERIEIRDNGRPMPELEIVQVQSACKSKGAFMRKFDTAWYNKITWLCGCEEKNALFCFVCLLCGGDDSWTREGVRDVKHLQEKVKKHEKSPKHLNNVVSLMFLGRVNVGESVRSADKKSVRSHNELVSKNRYVLGKIIDVLKLLGACDLTVSRGRSEFVELMEYTKNLDPLLYSHWENPEVFKDTSIVIQNELLDCMFKVYQKFIINEVKQSSFLACMIEDIMDLSTHAHIAVMLRYELKGTILERFWGFFSVDSYNAQGLSDCILKQLQPLLQDCPGKLVAQTYDGSKVFQDVDIMIRNVYPNAYYINCYAHPLNQLIEKATSHILSVKTFFANISKISAFFSNSIMSATLDRSCSIRRTRQGDTKWNCHSELIQTIILDKDLLLKCFENIPTGLYAAEIVCEAAELNQWLKDETFQFWLKFFSIVMPSVDILHAQLQKLQLEMDVVKIKQALHYFEVTILNIKNISYSSSGQTTGRDLNGTAREVCDCILNVVKERFQFQSHLHGAKLFLFDYYKHFKIRIPEDLERFCFAFPVVDRDALKTELSIFYSRPEFSENSNISGNLKTLNFLTSFGLDTSVFKETVKALKILVTLPMPTRNSEECCSYLRLIKSYLRNSKEKERITPLGMLSIQRAMIKAIPDFNTKVIEMFAGSKQNRKEFQYKFMSDLGDLDLSDSGAPSVDGNDASDCAGPAEVNDEGSSFSRDDFESCDLSDVKIKVEHTDDFCSEPETKRQRIRGHQEESKLEEALSILRDLKQNYSASQGPNDRFTLYGQHVAGKLRSYGEKTSAIVEHAVNNILFEADMGNYDGIHTALPSHDDSAQ